MVFTCIAFGVLLGCAAFLTRGRTRIVLAVLAPLPLLMMLAFSPRSPSGEVASSAAQPAPSDTASTSGKFDPAAPHSLGAGEKPRGSSFQGSSTRQAAQRGAQGEPSAASAAGVNERVYPRDRIARVDPREIQEQSAQPPRTPPSTENTRHDGGVYPTWRTRSDGTQDTDGSDDPQDTDVPIEQAGLVPEREYTEPTGTLDAISEVLIKNTGWLDGEATGVIVALNHLQEVQLQYPELGVENRDGQEAIDAVLWEAVKLLEPTNPQGARLMDEARDALDAYDFGRAAMLIDKAIGHKVPGS